MLADRTVLVTGGTGTIGAEIVTQVLRRRPKVVRILSRDENKQALLRMRLDADAPVRFLLGDIRDRSRLSSALDGVDVVFHAAALKHVPACEYNPFEAVQTNVIGTQNLIEACRETGVERLVAISTDKAVHPVNTMGATKLLAENVLSDAQRWNPRLVISTVRFGNVLGSRGSLIPLLAHRMEERREVELTSRRMTRFMMTIGDAVGLVLEAAGESEGGEIFILKMPALRVADLVEVYVREYAERRGWSASDIRIREIGARAGEKLHEELLTADEAARCETRERMYVVRPARRPAVDAFAETPPAETNSERATLLDREGILSLLLRAGVLDGIGEGAPWRAHALEVVA